jgi:hypothetical protein
MAEKNMRHANFMHLEVIHTNPPAAARFIRDVFGGQDVDVELTKKLGQTGSMCEHVLSGGMVYEFVKPVPELIGSQEQMKKDGPIARFASYQVDDVNAAVDVLLAAGCKLIGRKDDCAWIDAADKCALNFEIIKKSDEWVCHTGDRLTSDRGPFMHVEVVTSSPSGAADFMKKIWGAEDVETNISDKIGSFPGIDGCGCLHVLHGGMVYQFIAPGEGLPGWDKHLEAHGPSVHNICYHVEDFQQAVDALMSRGCKLIPRLPGHEREAYNLLYDGEADDLIDCAWIDATEQCGMIVELLRKNFQHPCHVGYFFW